jgi:hypothetical protein
MSQVNGEWLLLDLTDLGGCDDGGICDCDINVEQ